MKKKSKMITIVLFITAIIIVNVVAYVDADSKDSNSSENDSNSSLEGNVNITSAFINIDGNLTNILAEIIKLRKNTETIEKQLKKNKPRVTVVCSLNNKIKDAYYKPKLKEVPLLEENILSCGFVKAYTGFFDLDNTTAYKPEGEQSRALEILGYDFLLDSESYVDMEYSTKRTEEYVTKGTALMDIYKALDLSQYSLSLYFKNDKSLSMDSSPAVTGLPSYVHDIDTSRGRTDVFITRTQKELYYEKAKKDLNLSHSGMNEYLSNGDFIVLLARMMHFYGEPVLSKEEMNILLQVYGAEVPTYLTPIEQDAYLYLKSRGVLNTELDYRTPLALNDMLDILMCVYDKASRTDYKQVQVTMDIGDELINKGYFPRTVNLAVGDAALEMSSEYDYSEAKYYDYYIEVDQRTKFVDQEGMPVDYLFVPTVPTDQTSPELESAKYRGVITADDGIDYYHFVIDKIPLDSDYMKTARKKYKNNYIQVNTLDGSDDPAYMWMEQGGGVYTFRSGPNKERGISLQRREFKQDEFQGSVSVGRVEQYGKKDKSIVASIGSFFQNLGNKILAEPAVAKAVTKHEAMEKYSHGQFMIIKIEIKNAKSISYYDKNIPYLKVKKEKGNLVVKLPDVFESYFRASIQRDASKKDIKAYPAIATMSGDILLKYDDLVKSGVFFKKELGDIPLPEEYDDQILILDSEYGQIKINNVSREIVVGNILYKVKNDNTALFKYVVNKGKSELWVDFRVAYGWTNNIVDIVITGTGETYTVNMKLLKGKNKTKVTEDVQINVPKTFRTYDVKESGMILPSNGGDCSKFVLTSTYSLANWVIFQGVDRTSGTPKDYAFIFYPKNAFKKDKRPNDLKKMRDIVGYSIQADSWCCRVVELSRAATDKAGQFTYLEDFGYVYNLPEWEKFNIDKYLNGDYLLPLSADSGNSEIINANVNVFTGYPYGSRPVTEIGAGIDIKGQTIKGNENQYDSKYVIKAAPAGVSSLYGGAKRRFYNANSEILRLNQDSTNFQNVYYYGTTVCKVEKISSSKIRAKIEFTGKWQWAKNWNMNKKQKFYLTKMSVATRGEDGIAESFNYRWVTFNDVLTKNISNVEDKEDFTSILGIINGEIKDKFSDFEGFSLKYLITVIDNTYSWIILFTLEVMPYIGIVLVTILLGLSLISDMKIVRFLCDKTFDPIKVLTFGKWTIDQFTFKKAFLGLMLAYIGFALVVDGNLLRVIQWLLEGYAEITERIKYM